jgi:hypothetical protein
MAPEALRLTTHGMIPQYPSGREAGKSSRLGCDGGFDLEYEAMLEVFHEGDRTDSTGRVFSLDMVIAIHRCTTLSTSLYVFGSD